MGHAIDHGSLVEEVAPELRGSPPAQDHGGSPVGGLAHMALDLVGGRWVVHRSHRGAVLEGVPQADLLLDRGGEPRHVLVMDGLVHQDPFAGRATLAGVQEARREGGGDRGIDIGVLQDHERPVATHLEQELLPGRSLGDAMPGGDRPDEPDGLRSGVRRDLVADDGTGPGDHVE